MPKSLSERSKSNGSKKRKRAPIDAASTKRPLKPPPCEASAKQGQNLKPEAPPPDPAIAAETARAAAQSAREHAEEQATKDRHAILHEEETLDLVREYLSALQTHLEETQPRALDTISAINAVRSAMILVAAEI